MLALAASRMHGERGQWWLGAGGLISILWGCLLFVAPAEGALVMTWWLGGYALLFGIALIVLSVVCAG